VLIGKDISSIFFYSHGTFSHAFGYRSEDCWSSSLSLDVPHKKVRHSKFSLVDFVRVQCPLLIILSNRYLARLKSHVRNKARIEGSIAEGYLAKECLTFCSRYLESVEIVFNRPIRNSEHSIGAVLNIALDRKSWIQAHRYVLFNCDEIISFCK
jgi:hypothetical protein